ncbi:MULTISPECIES: LytR/AlgR family response regulator transcription factor [Pontibacillus]|uniref:LytTR family DNA-binding domain-containing protein n=1 Tax=Pontibacillus chungwhensis TaxID=265426 RepID=A0ABY8V2L9_9BACI|nr:MULTISPECIES: LytTR family DNA-binding domain-containing protein [Pontibacillus]MCD5322402.1 LytTR family DNA-binding domain-containing protein [Pontibacillus sp. HN14]WIF99688.1 LytTR family DNA-binding domain-containing protein [Pontibacillus chungwhensis]
MKYRVLIADDQDASRKLLKQMVEKIAGDAFEVIDEATDGEQLVEKVILSEPDLVLCDIEMPKQKGNEAIRACKEVKSDLQFIFTTAYDTFAVEAFNLNAVDYVMKPIQINRLLLALERAKKSLRHLKNDSQEEPKQREYQRIPIRFNRSLYYVQIDDILFIEKSDRKAVIHTSYEQYSSPETLEYFMEYLDDKFVQSHRSFIINLERISRIQTSGKSYLVYFHGYEEPAQISKQNIQRIQHLMNNFL